MHCLVDGDIVLFKACFATEYKVYNHPEFGQFRRKRELEDFLYQNYDDDEADHLSSETTVETILEPLELTFDVLESILENIRLKTNANHQTIFISAGGETFRQRIPYPTAYKGNRPAKPNNYRAVHNYLCNRAGSNGKYSVHRVSGIESDDELGIQQYSRWVTGDLSTIIASIDKDLLMIPGLHYNIDKEEIREVSLFEANKNYWIQMLMGDRVDNIIGVYGIGPRTAEKLLAPCSTWDDMERVVVEEYKKGFKDDWEMMYRANRELLWILRVPREN